MLTGAMALALSLHVSPVAAFHPGALSHTAAVRRPPPAAAASRRHVPAEGLRASKMIFIEPKVCRRACADDLRAYSIPGMLPVDACFPEHHAYAR